MHVNSDDSRKDSTMTRLMRSSGGENEILHRVLSMPKKYPGKIAFGRSNDTKVETKYTFESPHPIGEGGTAVVYRVMDTQLKVVRALKVLLVDIRSNPAAEQRWNRERELLLALEQVDAPCVPTIYDVGVMDGLPVIVVQYIEGDTLAKKIVEFSDRGPATPDASSIVSRLHFALGIIKPLSASLAHIEKHFASTEYEGFAHGDIKPNNILVEPDSTSSRRAEVGRVWLLDFGEASVRSADDSRGLTPAYSSPEQLLDLASQRSPQATPSTDQYQLGVVLQELLSPTPSRGSRWRLSPKAISSAWQIRHLARVSQRMTARRPGDRFPDFQSTSKAFRRTETLPRRRLAWLAATVGSLVVLMFVSGILAQRVSPSTSTDYRDSRDSRSLDHQLVKTTVVNEWKRWQEPKLWGASQQQLEEQLAAQYELWRSSYGKKTADAVVHEMRRRLSMLSGGMYRLQIVSAVPKENFGSQAIKGEVPEAIPDTVRLNLIVDRKIVKVLRGRIVGRKQIVFDQVQATFAWQPKQSVWMTIVTESKYQRDLRRRRQQEGQDFGEPFAPIGGNHTGGGVMSIPMETLCKDVDGNTFLGQFGVHSINWQIQIEPLD